MKAAVVGGGVFGCATAVALADAGFAVDLFEKERDLLQGASFANSGRLHLGYHYPRSDATCRETLSDAVGFVMRYPEAIVVEGETHHYAIATAESLTTPSEFTAFCDRMGLAYQADDSGMLTGPAVGYRVPERRIDLRVLASSLRSELGTRAVRIHLGYSPSPSDLLRRYSVVVDASYGQWRPWRPLQYEVCEGVLVSLPNTWAGKSWVVLDGLFVSIDPWPLPGFWTLYDVNASIHARNIGTMPEIPERLRPLINTGPVRDWSRTHYDAMAEVVSRFFPLRRERSIQYLWSLFTLRAVLPGQEATDARPTIVERDGRLITVFAGKLSGVVRASTEAVRLAREIVPGMAA